MGGYAPKFEARIDTRNLKVLTLVLLLSLTSKRFTNAVYQENHMDLEKALYCVCNPTSYAGWYVLHDLM